MNASLEQTHFGLIRRRFTLLEDGVFCQERTLLTSHEYKVSYETIPHDRFESRISSRLAFWFLVVLLGTGVLTFIATLFNPRVDRLTPLVYVLIAVPFAIRFIVSRKHFIGYNCGTRMLLFYKDKPSVEEVESFLAQIQRRRSQRLTTYFLAMQTSNAADQLEKLAWLQKQGSITEEEFRRLKGAIIGKAALASGYPGFHVN